MTLWETPQKCWLKGYEQTLNLGETAGKKNLNFAKLWKHNSPGTCDSPSKLFSHRRDVLFSNTAPTALSLAAHYSTRRTWLQGQAAAHKRDALKNKPSFGQSGFRWLGCSSKASSSLGQLIISMDARRWCSRVWRTSIKRPKRSAQRSRPWSRLSHLVTTLARPVVVGTNDSVPVPLSHRGEKLGSWESKKKKKSQSKLNLAVARESQTWPWKKGAKKRESFAGVRGRKDRCLISFSVDKWVCVFHCSVSQTVGVEEYFRLTNNPKLQTENN